MLKTFFLTLFCFSIYKMVDSMDIYISVKIIIGAVIKNPEMLKFVPDHKKCVNMQFQKLSYLLDYYLLSIIS